MQQTPNILTQSSPYGIVLFVILLWCLICFVIGMFSGWFVLAGRFKKECEPLGETRTAGPWFYTIYMRFWGHYSGVIRLTTTQDALFASVLLPFRIGHPPLRIPWSEITVGRTRFFFRKYVVLTLGNEERIPMRISQRMARKLGLFERFPAAANA